MSKYNTLVLSLRINGSGPKGVYIDDDLHLSARREGNTIKLFFTGPRDAHTILLNKANADLSHIDSALIEEVLESDDRYRERKAATNKKNSIHAKAPRLIY